MIKAFVAAITAASLPTYAVADPPSGSAVSDKFVLIWARTETSHNCTRLVASLNLPTLYDGNDLARSLLAGDRTYLWEQKIGKEEWRVPSTLGAIYAHEAPERLMVDLDGNGSPELLLRDWYEIKGQHYNKLLCLSVHHAEPGCLQRQGIAAAV
jgi:hypothetical protein